VLLISKSIIDPPTRFHEDGNTKTNSVAIILSLALVTSFPLSVYAYSAGPTGIFNSFESLASLFFWASLIGLGFLFPLRTSAKLYLRYFTKARGALVFVSYLTVHLFLYGLILEGILVYLYKIPQVFYQPAANFSSILAYPESFVSTLEDFAFNPSLNFVIPPSYSFALSLYSLGIAVVIAVLVVSNVMKVLEISKACTLSQRSRTFFALPAIGVVGGAACCLSLPFLISLAAPVSAVVSNSIGVYYAAYLGFPLATAIALKYNLDSTLRIASRL
jgi:hypothetical protein